MLTGLKLLLLKNEILSADLSLHVKDLACAHNPTGNPSAVAAEGPRACWLLAPTFLLSQGNKGERGRAWLKRTDLYVHGLLNTHTHAYI